MVRSSWIGRVLNPTTDVLLRGRKGDPESQRGEGDVKMEAETGVMQPQVKEL